MRRATGYLSSVVLESIMLLTHSLFFFSLTLCCCYEILENNLQNTPCRAFEFSYCQHRDPNGSQEVIDLLSRGSGRLEFLLSHELKLK